MGTPEMTDIPFIQTDRELAAFLKLSKTNGHKTIQRWARLKRIKARRIGKNWRFLRPDVQALLMGGNRGQLR